MNTLVNALKPTIHVCGRSLQKSRIKTRTVMAGTADVIYTALRTTSRGFVKAPKIKDFQTTYPTQHNLPLPFVMHNWRLHGWIDRSVKISAVRPGGTVEAGVRGG